MTVCIFFFRIHFRKTFCGAVGHENRIITEAIYTCNRSENPALTPAFEKIFFSFQNQTDHRDKPCLTVSGISKGPEQFTCIVGIGNRLTCITGAVYAGFTTQGIHFKTRVFTETIPTSGQGVNGLRFNLCVFFQGV